MALGPEVVKQIHARLVKIAQGNGLAQGRKMRVDTTVVETKYPLANSASARQWFACANRDPSAFRFCRPQLVVCRL